MTDNIFMISDASYSEATKCAGLGIIDLYTNQKYSHSLCNIKNSYIAEYRALYLSVYIAIKNKYDNVVFVYDNQTLNLDNLKLWLVDKIDTYQFLWLKRAYVDDADKLAKKARALHEKLIVHKAPSPVVDDTNLLQTFRTYSKKKIIVACMRLATKNEKIVLHTHIRNEKYSPIIVEEESLDFYSDIYHLLSKTTSKTQKTYLKFIDKNYAGTIDMESFLTPKADIYYIKLIKKIIAKLSEPKKEIKIKSKTIRGKALISAIKEHPVKHIVNFCAVIGSKDDKRLLKSYFSSKKIDAHTFDKNTVALYTLIHSLLPNERKNNFYRFIKKRINHTKLRKQFLQSPSIDFQTDMIKQIITKHSS